MMSPREKYTTDPEYHALVKHMVKVIDTLQFSPSEMREAAMLACLIYEETKCRHYPEFYAHIEGLK